LAETLDTARRTLDHYRIGSRPIPNMNGLASKRWEAERTREPSR
jgi:hypothetical protein